MSPDDGITTPAADDFLTVVILPLLALGCGSITGACRFPNGDVITHVYDANGDRWSLSRTEMPYIDGRTIDVCGISAKAVPITRPGQLKMFLHHDDYFTDEAGTARYAADGPHRG